MRALRFTSFLLLLPGVAIAQRKASPSTRAETAAEREVRQASADEVHGLMTADTTALRALWSDDLIVTNPLNALANKHQVLSMISEGTLAFQSYDRQIEYLRVEGNTAVVAGSEMVTWAGKMPLAGRPTSLRFTAVWTRRDRTWQETVRHANIIP